MQKLSLVLAITLISLAASATGCDDNDSERGGQQQSEQPEQADEEAADETGALADLPEELTIGEFTELAQETACYAYETCKNERIRETVALRVMFPVSVGVEMGMSRVTEALTRDYQELGRQMNQDSTKVFDGPVCVRAADVAMRFLGLDAQTLGQRVAGGGVEFDPRQAVACIEHLRDLPEICDVDEILDSPLSFGDIHLPGNQGGDEIDAYIQGCSDMLVGTRGDGEECTYNYECTQGLTCVISPLGDGQTGECTAPGGGNLRAP